MKNHEWFLNYSFADPSIIKAAVEQNKLQKLKDLVFKLTQKELFVIHKPMIT